MRPPRPMTLPRSSGWTRTSRARPRRRPRLSTRTSSGYSTMPLTRCSRASSSTSGLAARLASGGLGVGLLRLLGRLGRAAVLRRALGRRVGLGGLGRRLGLRVLSRGVLGRSVLSRGFLGRGFLGRASCASAFAGALALAAPSLAPSAFSAGPPSRPPPPCPPCRPWPAHPPWLTHLPWLTHPPWLSLSALAGASALAASPALARPRPPPLGVVAPLSASASAVAAAKISLRSCLGAATDGTRQTLELLAGDLEDLPDRVGGLSADRQPVLGPLGVDPGRARPSGGICRSSIARPSPLGAGVGHDDPVVRRPDLAQALQLDLDSHGCGFLPAGGYEPCRVGTGGTARIGRGREVREGPHSRQVPRRPRSDRPGRNYQRGDRTPVNAFLGLRSGGRPHHSRRLHAGRFRRGRRPPPGRSQLGQAQPRPSGTAVHQPPGERLAAERDDDDGPRSARSATCATGSRASRTGEPVTMLGTITCSCDRTNTAMWTWLAVTPSRGCSVMMK